jgi:Arc/MetJ family transcription regulator
MRTRTWVDIDDGLMRRAMRTGKGRTKRAVVEAGLRLLVQIHAQTGIRRLKGKIRWDGNLQKSC